MTKDPVKAFGEVRKKVQKYYADNPGADYLPEALARELAERTREYHEYLERRRKK